MTLINMSGNNNGSSQPSVLQRSSALNTESNTAMQIDEAPPDSVVIVEQSIKSEVAEGKSSISVYFKDWIPANDGDPDGSTPCAEENRSSQNQALGPEPKQYNFWQRGQEKIRPGLGTSIEDLVAISANSKPKKRKAKPIMQKLMESMFKNPIQYDFRSN